MAKLQRKSAKLFAEDATAAAGGLAQFGSLAAGTPNYSTDPDVIQALQAYKDGWSSAVLGTKSPALEDRNALDYLLSYQQAYIMQRGIPEWLDTETYYQGSFAAKANGALYVSKVDNNTGHDPALDSTETYWMKFPTPAELAANYVAKAGDTMTGSLTISSTPGDLYLVDSASNTRGRLYNFSGSLYLVNGSNGKGIKLNTSDGVPQYFDGYNAINMSHFAMPNYSAGVAYTTNTWIAAPSDGWFLFKQDTGNYAAATISICAPGDTSTPLAYFYYRNYNDSNTAMIPVPKGYNAYFTTSYGYTLTFYPCFTN